MNPTFNDLAAGKVYLINLNQFRDGESYPFSAIGTVVGRYEDVVFDDNGDPDGYGTYIKLDNDVRFTADQVVDISVIHNLLEVNDGLL